jgi:hypothetical protein
MKTPTELTRMQEAADRSGFRLIGHYDLGGHGASLVYMTDGGAGGLYVRGYTG